MLRKYLMVLVVGLMALNARLWAQNKRIDSLENKILTAPSDTNKVNLLIDLAIQFSETDSVKAINNIKGAFNLATKLNYVSGQIDALNNWGILYMDFSNQEKALPYLKQVEQLAIKYNREELLGRLYSNMGNLYSDWHKSNDAIAYYNKSIEYNLKYNNKRGVAITYNNLGNAFIQKGDLIKATEYLLKGLKIREEINDKKGIATMSSNLSVLYKELAKYDEALAYGKGAVTVYKSLNMPIDVGRVYVNLGLIANRKNNYPEAELYFKEALESFKGTTYTKGMAAAYSNMGLVLRKENKLEEALKNYSDAYQLALSTKDKQAQAIVLNELGNLTLLKKDFSKSESYLLNALQLANDVDYLELKKDVNESLVSLYKEQGNFEKAYLFELKFRELKDSIYGIDKIKIIEDIKTKYETEKKDYQINILSKTDSIKSLQITNQQLAINTNLYQIAQQKLALADADLALLNDSFLLATKNGIILRNQLDSTQKEERIGNLNKQSQIQNLELNNQKLEVTRKNIMITVIVVLAAMGLLLGYSFYRRYKLQQQTKLQHEILKQQDIATKAIIAAEETERKRIATDLHDGVGQLMSAAKMNLSAIESDLNFTSINQKNAYDKAMALVDEGCKEVRAVSHNMMPNALLRAGLASAVREFLDNLNSQVIKINLYVDGLNERIDSNTETILYRVIQECVNNVIKHAKASLLDISIVKEAENISVTIEDNGVGFDKNNLKNGTGIGLKNIETRMAFLKGSVEWESQPGKGTLVVLHVVC